MTTLEKEIDMYFPVSLREVAKKQLHLLIEIAALEGETKAYRQCNQEIKTLVQPDRRDGFIYKSE